MELETNDGVTLVQRENVFSEGVYKISTYTMFQLETCAPTSNSSWFKKPPTRQRQIQSIRCDTVLVELISSRPLSYRVQQVT